MKRFLSILFPIFIVMVLLPSWNTGATAYADSIDLTDRVSDVAVYTPGAFNDYGDFPAEFGMTFSLVNPDGSPANSNYFYRPADDEYDGILPVLDIDPSEDYDWGFSSSRTRVTFANPASAFSVDIGDKGEDADIIYLSLYRADGVLISAISGEIDEGDNNFHTLEYDYGSFDIAYVDFWGVDPTGKNTVYFNNVSFTPVPLPGSLLLLGSGLVTCMLSRRKRRTREGISNDIALKSKMLYRYL